MKRGGPLKRYSRLRAYTPLRRYTALASSSAKATPQARRLPIDVRASAEERSAGWCEAQLPGCTGLATQPHHRVTRKAGGRHGAAAQRSDRLSNLLHLDASCHSLITDHPGRAYTYGLSLREFEDPALTPVLYRGELSYLDDLGGVHSFEKAGA